MEITWTCVGVSGPQMDDFSSHQDCSEALFTFSFDLDLEFALLHLQRAPLSRGKKERRSSSLLVSYLYFTRNMTGCHLITAFMSFGKTQNYLIWKMGIHFKSENGRFFISSVTMPAWNLIMICQLSSHLMENQDLWIFLFFPMSHLFQLQGTEGFWKIEVFITKRGACLSDTQQKIYANWLEQKKRKNLQGAQSVFKRS